MRIESNKYATFRGLLLAGGGLSALSIGFAPAAVAQPAAQPVEKVTVTGTRIPQKNLITSSPVTQVTAADVDAQGVTRLEDLTNQLPQVFAAQNSTVSNGATGNATVNLRGLGASRTLVLINGRRMPYGSPFSSAADINAIPAQLVDRVEVLTGGASAVYGSDAIAGVVNFIMRKDFEGLQVDAQYGFFQHHNNYDEPGNLRAVIAARGATNPAQFKLPPEDVNDGIGKEITGVLGVSSQDGKGNITGYIGYRSNDPILQRDRDYSACSLGGAAPPSYTCGGSGTSFPGDFASFGANAAQYKPTVFGDPTVDRGRVPDFNFTVENSINGFRNFNTTLDQYNFGPLNFYQRPDERYAMGLFSHYQLNDQIEAYADLMFSDYTTNAQIAPSGDFGNTSTINCDNPLLSPRQEQLLCEGFVLDNDPVTAGAQFGLGLGADNAAGGLNTAGPDGILGDNPATSTINEAADDVINADNEALVDPDLLTPGNQAIANLTILRRNVEGGGRQDHLNYKTYRFAGGFRGEVVEGLDYDMAMQYSKVSLSRVYRNDFSVTRIQRALDVVDADPGVGVDPQCRSAVDGTDPACVPYNVFTLAGQLGGVNGLVPGGITPEALNYLQVPLMQQADVIQRVATLSFNADLGTWGMKSPWAESPFAMAFGAEFRRDELTSTTDTAFATGDGAGQGGPTIGLSGSVDVSDYFVELEVPLVEDGAFAKEIKFDLAYRYSDYDTGITTDTYKIGADWAPTEDFKVRASMQRAVRAANIVELFTAQGFNLFDMADDPCGSDAASDGGAGNGVASAAACVGTNPWQVDGSLYLTGGLNSPAGQYNFLQGGNTTLAPEESDTKTVGVVLTPGFIKNLVVSVDWFNILVDNTISTVGADNTITACYFFNDLTACNKITRNPGTGQIWLGAGNVVDLNTNIGSLETTGVDVNGSYRFDLDDIGLDGSGGIAMTFIGTWLDELIVDTGLPFGPHIYDCAGFFSGPCASVLGNGPSNEWRHRFRTTWSTPWDADVSVTWRHYSEVELTDASNPGKPVLGRLDSKFDAEDYIDLNARIGLPLNSTLRLGVNNVFDNDPPITASAGTTGNGNTYPQTYDATGRWFFVGISVDM